MSNYRESSKANWTNTGPITIEHVNAGSLQRIADATELMAKNYAHLVGERDRLQQYHKNAQDEIMHLCRRISAMRGAITRLKAKP